MCRSSVLRVEVPGHPLQNLRPRSAFAGRGAGRVYDPSRNREWRGVLKTFAIDAAEECGWEAGTGPYAVRVLYAFALPASQYRKRHPVPVSWATGARDVDNLEKIVLDALTGVAWVDDRYVAHVEHGKVVAAQGEPPRTVVEVREAPAGGAAEFAASFPREVRP